MTDEVTPRTRENRIDRRRVRCSGVGRDSMPLTCPRCGWPCDYFVTPYYDSPWKRWGGICGECCREAVIVFDRDGWPPDPLEATDAGGHAEVVTQLGLIEVE